MTKAEKIEKLKKGIESGHVTGDNLVKMKATLAQLEAEESQEPKEKSQESRVKSQDTPKAKVKVKDLAPDRKSECNRILDEAIAALEAMREGKDRAKSQESRAKTSKERPKPKKASELLSGGITASLKRVIKPEMTADKVKRINLDYLESAKKSFAEGLKFARKAFGSISENDDKMITSFTSEIDDLIKTVKEKQNADK